MKCFEGRESLTNLWISGISLIETLYLVYLLSQRRLISLGSHEVIGVICVQCTIVYRSICHIKGNNQLMVLRRVFLSSWTFSMIRFMALMLHVEYICMGNALASAVQLVCE